MDEDPVLICCTWDSGPYGVYYESTARGIELNGPGGYSRNTVPIPAAVWERYRKASAELREAEDALCEAKQAGIKTLRASDPRWIAHAAAAEREP